MCVYENVYQSILLRIYALYFLVCENKIMYVRFRYPKILNRSATLQVYM